MGNRGVGHKDNREILRIARANGARIVDGKKHLLIFDGPDLVVSLSRGGHRTDRGRPMKEEALKRFRKRGWRV